MPHYSANLAQPHLPLTMAEKVMMPHYEGEVLQERPKRGLLRRLTLGFLTIASLFYGLYILNDGWHDGWRLPSLVHHQHVSECTACAQFKPFQQTENTSIGNLELFKSESYRSETIERFSNIIRIPSVSYDDLGPIGEDKRWEIFQELHEFIETTFPRVHDELKQEKINTYGLFYEWKGSNRDLKPILLMAHQDVVPVLPETVNLWKYPPFSGHYDGTNVWGRGTFDTKNTLLAIFEAIEALIESGFHPQRTILLSFGMDEECSGYQGAATLAPHIEKKYGKDGLEFILDEGTTFQKMFGKEFAVVGTGEKGYMDLHILLETSGGHSSLPPVHTSVGIMSELISTIENNQYEPHLQRNAPFYGMLQCWEKWAEISKPLSRLIKRDNLRRLTKYLSEASRSYRFQMQTSVAADIFHGGLKVNALPENVKAVVNHRIALDMTPDDVKKHAAKLARGIAKKYDLNLDAFGIDMHKGKGGRLSLWGERELSAAPESPLDSSSWAYLSSMLTNVFGEDIIVTPGMALGNTDTKYYWDLTRNIYRFAPSRFYDDIGGGHTVNEHLSVSAHLDAVEFFHELIRGGMPEKR